MCDHKEHLNFCTCGEVEPKSMLESTREAFLILRNKAIYHSTFYAWALTKIQRKRTKQEIIIGQLILPSKKLDDTVTAKYGVAQLNAGAAFDFDYQP